MAQVNLNVTELKGFINHIITNNRFLQKEGKNSVSVEVVGESGIGKTSTIVEMAEENKLNFVKVNHSSKKIATKFIVSYEKITINKLN